MRILLLLFSFLSLSPLFAGMQTFKEDTIIRDAEIEAILHEFADPIFTVAGMDPKDLQLYVITSKDYNAFATQGSEIFVTTTLLLEAKSAAEVIGVYGHEIGHVAGGHILRRVDMAKRSTTIGILGTVIGVATGVLSGNPLAGIAVATGGQQFAESQYLRHSRTHEASADQASVSYLEKLHWPTTGVEEVMKSLGRQELLLPSQQTAYARTHPFSRDRLTLIEHHVQKQKASRKSVALPVGFEPAFKRLQAKLFGFLKLPAQTFKRYPESDKSPAARIARSLAYFQESNLPKALGLVDGLLQEEPENPFLWELKGQMLFEGGKLPEAVEALKNAWRLAPSEPLIGLLYAHALVETGTPAAHSTAREILVRIKDWPNPSPFAWHLLAMIDGTRGDLGLVALDLAEKALLEQDWKTATGQSKRALELLPNGSPAALRASDVLNTAKDAELAEKT